MKEKKRKTKDRIFKSILVSNTVNSYYTFSNFNVKKALIIVTTSVVEGLESMTSNPVTSLAWV
jgi:hypothetical protein